MTEEELKEYGNKIKKENSKRSKRNIIISLLIVFFGFIFYWSFSGDFIPFIHKTKTVKAKIIEVKKYHWGKGVYKYMMTYEFKHNGNYYNGNYDLWKNIDKKGDSVLVKYVTNKP